MSSTIADLNLVASGWAGAVGRACWQGGLAISLVWALCRILPRLPGRVQCWLWRLAYLKLLVALLWGAPLCLPLLPPSPSLAPLAAPGERPPAAAPGSQLRAPREEEAERLAAGSLSLPGAGRPTRSAGGYPGPGADLPPGAAPKALRGLLLLWLLGVAGVGAQVLGDWRRTRRLRSTGEAVRDEALLADCRALSGRFDLRREPALLTADDLSCPVLVGVARPAVVLPASFPAQFTPSQMRLMLAHELAHLKRRDLLWAWLPSLARVLFFFHPLVWLAEGEWRLAQEMACDEQVVLSTGASQARYGAMLLEVMGEPRRAFPASLLAAGVAESYATLRRRLVAIQRVRAVSPRGHHAARGPALAALLLAATGIAAVVPWRLTARPARLNRAASPGELGRMASDTVRPSDRRGSEISSPRASAAPQPGQPLPQREDRLPEPVRLARLAAPRLQPARGPRPPGQFRSAVVPTRGARPSSLELARGEADDRVRAGLIAGPQNGGPPLIVAPDAGGVDAPPAPVDPGPKEGFGKQPSLEPFEVVDLPGKEPSSLIRVKKPGDEGLSRLNPKEWAFTKEPAFQKRAGISAVLLMPKSIASKAAPLGWSPSPLLHRPERLTLGNEREIDPRDLKKMLVQARQDGIIDPKLVEQMRWIDPRVLKKILAQDYPASATDVRSKEDAKGMAFIRSLAEALRKRAYDPRPPDKQEMVPSEKDLLRTKALDQLKRQAEKRQMEEMRHDGSVDEDARDR